MTKKVDYINKDITRSRIFRDLVFYIKITRVIVVFSPFILNGQDSLLSQNDKLSKREKWKILRQKTERDVDSGEISREEADKKYKSPASKPAVVTIPLVKTLISDPED